jgi:chitinase
VKINGKKTKTLKLFANVDAEKAPSGDSWDDGAGVDACGAETGPGGSWTIWGMVKAGFLTKKGVPAKGIESRFDTCSQTVSSHLWIV